MGATLMYCKHHDMVVGKKILKYKKYRCVNPPYCKFLILDDDPQLKEKLSVENIVFVKELIVLKNKSTNPAEKSRIKKLRMIIGLRN